MLAQIALPIKCEDGNPIAPFIIFSAKDQPWDWKTRKEWEEVGYKVELSFAQTRVPKAYIRKGTSKVELWDMDQVDIIHTDEAYRKRQVWDKWVWEVKPWNRFSAPTLADRESQ